MVTFSKSLIQEYRTEMAHSYGIFVTEQEAQSHILSLTRSLFPTDIAVESAESRNEVQGKAEPTCTELLSATMKADGGHGVGASITPTSGHTNE